jgi:hypothetical protein
MRAVDYYCRRRGLQHLDRVAASMMSSAATAAVLRERQRMIARSAKLHRFRAVGDPSAAGR